MGVCNVGIIGYGGFGKFLHHCWKPLKNVRVHALADKTAWKYEGQDKDIRIFSEWRNLVHARDVDLVVIATVPYTHEMIACAAMEAGKAVLIEKPLAIALRDGQKIIETRDRCGATASIDYIMRYNPLLAIIATLTKQNMFGVLRRVDVENYAQDEQLPPDHWFWNPELSGGIAIEHAVHFIDMVNMLDGTAAKDIYGAAYNRNSTQEDQVLINVLYENGLLATHYHSFARPGFFENTTIRLEYDLAQIDLVGWIPLKGTISALVNPESRRAIQQMPHMEICHETAVTEAQDLSRPKGWGTVAKEMTQSKHEVYASGIAYEVNEIIEGTFDIGRPKEDVYAECVQASLLDVVTKIENPGHAMRVSLEDGLSSLEVAVKATQCFRPAPPHQLPVYPTEM